MKINLKLTMESTIEETLAVVTAVRYTIDGVPQIPDVPLDSSEYNNLTVGDAFKPSIGGTFILESGTYNGTVQLVLADGSLIGEPYPFMVNIPVLKMPVPKGVTIDATPAP